MNSVKLLFLDGAKVEIEGDDLRTKYGVEFIDSATSECVYKTTIVAGQWAMASPKYYVKWRVVVKVLDQIIMDYTLDLTGRQVLITFDSKSLGDSVGWIPFVEEFRKIHNCHINVMTFRNEMFREIYPDLNFIKHDEANQPSYFAVYRLGAYDNDYQRNRNNWRCIPLQQIASDILGIPYREIQPRVKRSDLPAEIEKPYVCISEFSTWYAKFWSRVGGWQDLVNRLKDVGYQVVSISTEPCNLEGVIKRNGLPIEETIRHIQHADLFIGVSCGPLLLAWALGIPTCIVSGSTQPFSEFTVAARVYNRDFCHGCFNDTRYPIDRNNWKFCPRGRNFECGSAITTEMVWKAIEPILSRREKPKGTRVLFVSPHCSTGGGPQYLLRSVEELKHAGHEVEVVEYNNISDMYVVQRNKIKSLATFHTLNGSKLKDLNAIIQRFKPDVVHLHEFPERFVDADVAAMLYDPARTYKIIETAHSSGIGPEAKVWWPDGFAFVSQYHAGLFKNSKVPFGVVEYTLPVRRRPERKEALSVLGLDPGRKHVLNVGLFTPYKNQGQVFDVARKLPNVQFHFVGNTADNFKDYWMPLMSTKPENCTVWGEQTNVDQFYAAMDVMLFTSKSELNPLVVKEALSWQMPVLLRNLPTYCSAYDNNPLVTYVGDDIDEIVGLIEPRTMAAGMNAIYAMVSNDR